MYDYNCPDCNEAKLQSDKNARKINEVIDQVNNLIQVNNETVDFIEEKAEEKVEEIAEIKVSEKLGDIKTSLDNIVQNSQLNILDFGAKQDGVTDNTEVFKKACATGRPILVPNQNNMEYIISERINITNNIVGVGYPKIRMKPKNSQTNIYDSGKSIIIQVLNQSKDIIINGLHLIGNYDTIATTEHSHGIAISSTDNVKVFDNIIENTQGDCIYVGNHSFTEGVEHIKDSCDNVKIYNNRLINPYRCCVANVSTQNLIIENNYMNKKNNYVACIDNEPNIADNSLVFNTIIRNNNILVENDTIAIHNYNANNNVEHIFIKNNKIKSKGIGIRTSSAQADYNIGRMIIQGNTFNCDKNGISVGGMEKDELIIKDNVDINNNGYGWITYGKDTIINGNIFKAKTKGKERLIFINCECVNSVSISDNTIKDVTGSDGAIVINGSDGNKLEYVNIVNNTFNNCNKNIIIKNRGSNTTFSVNKLNISNNILYSTDCCVYLYINVDELYMKNLYNGVGVKLRIGVSNTIGKRISDEAGIGNQDYCSDKIPTERTSFYGTFVRNTNISVLGESGSKYVIVGWIMNQATGWEEVRCLVGK